VILIRDSNLESNIETGENSFYFERVIEDNSPSSESFSRGGQLIKTLNAANMVVLNGIDSGGEFTFKSTSGQSMIDYIAVSENILFPGSIIQQGGNLLSGNSHSLTKIPLDSLYCCHSCKIIWSDYEYVIGDHFLLTCQIQISYQNNIPHLVQKTDEKLGIELNINKWNRRDGGNAAFWEPMRMELENSLAQWDIDLLNRTNPSINCITEEFNSSINSALVNSLRIRKRSTSQSKPIFWNPEIFKLTGEEKLSYQNYQKSNIEQKPHYEHCWKLAKRKLKNTIRKAHQQRLQAQVQQIESLRSKDPRQYWRGLYDLEGPITVGEKIPLQIKNSLNVVVKGDEACKVWMDSFSKLGREASDF